MTDRFKRTFVVLAILLALPLIALTAMAVAPGQWLGKALSTVASAASGKTVDVNWADLKLFQRNPELVVRDTRVSVVDSDETIASVSTASVITAVSAIWSQKPLLQRVQARDFALDLSIDANGRANWSQWVANPTHAPGSTQDSPSQQPDNADNVDLLPVISSLPAIELQQAKVRFQDAQSNRLVEAVINVTTERTDNKQTITIESSGTANTLPLQLTANGEWPLLQPGQDTPLQFTSSVELGDSKVNANGSIGDLLNLRELDVELDLQAPSLQDTSTLTGITLPVLPPLTLSGTVKRDNEQFVLQRFNSTLGDSDMEGDIRIDLTTATPTVYANLISTLLDLDDLAGLIGGNPDPTETVSASQRASAQAITDNSTLLPSRKIPVADLLRRVVGAVDFEAKQVLSPLLPIDGITMRVELDETTARFSPFEWRVADGTIEGEITADLSNETIDTTIDLAVKHLNLREFMEKLGLSNDGFGQIGGQIKMWMQGDSVAELAASADGGLFLIMTQGRLNALITELAGLDLAETAVLLATDTKESTEIKCVYADLHTRSGTLTLETMVADTRDTVFLASGTVDFNNETLDLVVEPHPKDLSVLAAQTSVNIGGQFTDPAITPGATLPLRAAAAAVLSTVAAPVAALIPFITLGEGQDSPYCNGLASSLNQQP